MESLKILVGQTCLLGSIASASNPSAQQLCTICKLEDYVTCHACITQYTQGIADGDLDGTILQLLVYREEGAERVLHSDRRRLEELSQSSTES